MANYKLSIAAKEDLIRIHQYGIKKFGMAQADKYFETLFEYFDVIAQSPYSFESVDEIKSGYRRCVFGIDSIYYKINDDTVEIIAIIGRQDLNDLF
ncbi:MAG: type II toxin-antitoxin system RelE/ParE family toxin [Flavobacteriaceae bacterium CG_4_8_14_3_um_filter_34_10]|nr:type II toxin-antitoxin system RelE/ParE family toxin [Flavobacteriia bacterium]PIQ17570.1 MAG: plasmid stabilization protein [Flavobacteriaceae bacterium CG18_big_fil_WC_8_21_14_2_50_34_36]PIV51534.1 MAG: type II toxin-antitoxin system RelE/ParE family toxin [Flavobacteriaceae bacterium CG02_land_8_20_14_3_00_34_13]PIX09254.1 MAG: type II toxin-antitoxin system RelE/ParE family toxin [Flavobacteriaceae bacterium CG_4_8_14_3_um_filter_34_10]PJC06364.1 MAG: type II toxin-antitoxin system RelE